MMLSYTFWKDVDVTGNIETNPSDRKGTYMKLKDKQFTMDGSYNMALCNDVYIYLKIKADAR